MNAAKIEDSSQKGKLDKAKSTDPAFCCSRQQEWGQTVKGI